VILNRRAPLDLRAIAEHLKPRGYFIIQQVAERNMTSVKAAVGQVSSAAALHQILAGNVDERGFVTNEHRHLAVARAAVDTARPA
jgi:hypothetical protein